MMMMIRAGETKAGLRWKWRNSSFLIYASWFAAMMWGKQWQFRVAFSVVYRSRWRVVLL